MWNRGHSRRRPRISEVSPPAHSNALGANGQVERWNGATWTASSIGVLADDLAAVWGVSATDIWTVGATGVQQWNGSAWTYLPRPGNGDTFGASSIWGTAATDLWMVADEVYHWDGTQWTDVDTGIDEVKSIWGTSTSDVWGVANGSIAHWDGAAWTPATLPDGTSGLIAIWGTSTSDAWAVAGRSIVHWDGTSWTSTMELVYALTAIGGTSASDVWAGGDIDAIWASASAGTSAVGDVDTILHHD